MKALIVGCGRMGQRYADALVDIVDSLELTTVDPNGPGMRGSQHVRSLADIGEDGFDLAIDAATNLGRADRFAWFVSRQIPNVVVEKPHAQSLQESAAMMKLAEDTGTRVLIPFYRRFAQHYLGTTLKKLAAGRLTGITITAGAIGMGCNGVHFLDLANYLFDEMPNEVFADLSLDTISSPRGEEFRDFGGMIYLKYSAGSCTLNVDPNAALGVLVELSFEYGKIIFHKQQEPEWFWYRRDDGGAGGPLTRTHLEKRIEPSHGLDLDLIGLIKNGLTALIERQAHPGLREGHIVLNQIQTALESDREKRMMPFELRNSAADTFNFT